MYSECNHSIGENHFAFVSFLQWDVAHSKVNKNFSFFTIRMRRKILEEISILIKSTDVFIARSLNFLTGI